MEGFFDSSFELHGFARTINAHFGEHAIGWNKDATFHGNVKVMNFDGSVNREGWFEDSALKGDYNPNEAHLENAEVYFDKDE